MWVRSQDKILLINCNSFELLSYEENSVFVIWGSNNNWLGQYTTQEKALKVLDMLEQCVSGFTDEETSEFYNYGVFQIPQDDEVE